MPTIQITEDQAALLHNGETVNGMKLIEECHWKDCGKYGTKKVIFSKDNKRYSNILSRSGSFFTHYEYEYSTRCTEVQCVEIITHEWREVKSQRPDSIQNLNGSTDA